MEPPGMSLPSVPRGNAHGLRTHGNESDGVINYNAKYTLVNTFPPANQLQVETQKARWRPELAGRWPCGCRRGGLADRCHLPPKRPLWPVKLRGPCCPRHTPRVRGAGPARHGARSPGSLSCPCEGRADVQATVMPPLGWRRGAWTADSCRAVSLWPRPWPTGQGWPTLLPALLGLWTQASEVTPHPHPRGGGSRGQVTVGPGFGTPNLRLRSGRPAAPLGSVLEPHAGRNPLPVVAEGVGGLRPSCA